MRKIGIGVAIGAMALGGLALTPGTASADWNGSCDPISFTTSGFTGWCDGTGPEKYGTWVTCSNSGTRRYYSTYTRAYGDRRGVYAGCTSGKRVTSGFWAAP